MTILKRLLQYMPKVSRLFAPFTLMLRVFGTLRPPVRRKSHNPVPSNIFHTCNETPLSVFISCACDHDYRSLVKHGRASQDQLAKAWEMIYSEYSECSGNSTTKLLMKLSNDIKYQDNKLRQVGICLKVLSHGPNKDAIYTLKEIYGYNHPFDITRPEEYARSLEAIATKTGSIIFTLQLKNAEFEREKVKLSGKPMTREAYTDMLAVLAGHYHLSIRDFMSDTVAAFVAYKKRYEMEMKALEKQSNYAKINRK